MDNLPAEILHVICAQLDPYEVESFRLLNQRCATIGFEYLRSVISIKLISSSWERLQRICNHQALRRNVQTVEFLPLRLPDPVDLSLHTRISMKKQLLSSWYIAEHQRGDDLVATLEAMDEIAGMLSHLARLRSFALPGCEPVGDFPFKFEMADIKGTDLVLDSSGHVFAFKLLESLLIRNPLLNQLELYSGRQDANHLLRASYILWPELLKNVQHISWDLSFFVCPLDRHARLFSSRIFAAQNQLRTIKMGHFSSVNQHIHQNPCTNFFDVVTYGRYFNNLEELYLEHVYVGNFFENFLRQHSPTLKRLFLHSISQSDCDMFLLFIEIGKLSLDKLVLDGTWYPKDEHHESLRMRDRIGDSEELPTIGQLIYSVIKNQWCFIDQDDIVRTSNRSAKVTTALQTRLLTALTSWKELADLFSGSLVKYDGHINFQKDLLFQELGRYLRIIEKNEGWAAELDFCCYVWYGTTAQGL